MKYYTAGAFLSYMIQVRRGEPEMYVETRGLSFGRFCITRILGLCIIYSRMSYNLDLVNNR